MKDDGLNKEAMREFWTKSVSIDSDQLKKILETLKWDLETFYAAYCREVSGTDASKDPKPEEVETVTSLEADGDYDQLLFRLGTSHPVIADSAVIRVIQSKYLPH